MIKAILRILGLVSLFVLGDAVRRWSRFHCTIVPSQAFLEA